MAVYKETIKLTSHGGTPSFFNVTPQVKEAIANSGIKNVPGRSTFCRC